MDPLSVAASVAGLIGLGEQIFSAAFKYAQAVRYAEEDIASFVRELTGLLRVLKETEGLSDALDKEEKISTTTLRDALKDCKSTLDHILGRLQDIKSMASSKTRVEEVVRRLKWPFSSSKTKEMIADLERHKSLLSFVMQYQNVALSVGLKQSQQRIETTQQTIMEDVAKEKTLQAILEAVAKMNNDQANIMMIIGSQQNINRDSALPAYTNNTEELSSDISNREKKILEGFVQIDSTEVYTTMLDLITPGTTEWIFEESTFQDWISGHVKIIWLKGGLGTGKTVLAAAVVKKLASDYIDGQDRAMAFFMCRWSDCDTPDKAGAILSSFAAQLADQGSRACERLEEFHRDHERDGTTASTISSEDLQELVLSMSYDFKTVYMIVDALDEWWTDGSFGFIMDLSRHCRRIRILFTSRALTSFEEAFRGCQSIDISVARDFAMKFFVQHEVENRFPNVQADLRKRIEARLLEVSGGMFLWVKLALRRLEHSSTKCDIDSALESLPIHLEETYNGIFDRILTSNSPSSSRLIVACLLVLAAPQGHRMSSSQLLEAAGFLAKIEDAPSIRLNTLAPLTQDLVCQDDDGTVALMHWTLGDYINHRRDQFEAYLNKSTGDVQAYRLALSRKGLD